MRKWLEHLKISRLRRDSRHGKDVLKTSFGVSRFGLAHWLMRGDFQILDFGYSSPNAIDEGQFKRAGPD